MLLLNAVATVVHLSAFVVLLVLVNVWGVDMFSKPLEESITVWEKITDFPTCDQWRNSSFQPSDASCFETTNEGLFAIYKAYEENGELTLGYLILSFSFLSFFFQGLRPFLGLKTSDEERLTYLDEWTGA